MVLFLEEVEVEAEVEKQKSNKIKAMLKPSSLQRALLMFPSRFPPRRRVKDIEKSPAKGLKTGGEEEEEVRGEKGRKREGKKTDRSKSMARF